jgi:hypothetical protein
VAAALAAGRFVTRKAGVQFPSPIGKLTENHVP